MVTIYPPGTRLVLPAFTLDKLEFHHRDNANIRSHKLNTLVKFVQDAGADGAITNAKLGVIETNRIKGRIAPGAGQVQDLSPADVRTMINVADGATANLGTVTSVGFTVPIGFNLSGSPITTSGTLSMSYAAGYDPYTSAEKTKLAGIAAGATANLGTVTSVSGTGTVNGLTLSGNVATNGALTLGGLLTISNADWSGAQLAVANGGTGATTAAQARVNLGAGTVTSVAGAGSVNGLTLIGTVTSSGALTLGGTLSGVDLTAAVTGSLPIANGGTGSTTAVGARAALGAGTVTNVTGSGSVNGLSLSGSVTTSGAISITGTLTISNADWSGADLAIVNGGTGASTASGALSNLGAAASGLITASGLTAATGQLLGRSSAGTGAVEQISVGAGLTLSAGTLSAAGGGSVSSVNVSGGSTGLTFSGGPITTSGTITMAGTLAVANGGTGSTTSTGTGAVVRAAAPTFTGDTRFDTARVSDGSVTAPTLAFRSETGLGFYRSATGTGSFVAGGAISFNWTSEGLRVPNNKSLILNPVVVASLPTASTVPGARRTVSDSTITTFYSVVTGGGANTVPVFSDGTSWRVG